MTISFFAGFFAGEAQELLPEAAPLACLIVFAMAATWFTLVGFLVSHPAFRRLLSAGGRWIRFGVAGGLLGMAALAVWRAAV
ncbi:hypothetical protein [Methylobacterium nodulans]|uniref:Lysine exporter protein (LYSE/YGGA) n=1 Tax=Methylobacterium nodulans (strain LMG 21967 / CNCM I-2342 / ORS 2060) TaxID=460265 RepID=B8IBK7_METNO|nr:hypothetical protein [Methylobacterium nodulans]ACL59261.1 hypothetical protein Mnod_4390 [Methylobacterium nodulans ORS 2060]